MPKSFSSILIILGWLIIVFITALVLRTFSNKKEELTRKIIHIGTGPIIPLAWWLEISRSTGILASIIVTFCLITNYKFKLIPGIEDINRKSYGTIAYSISITLLMIFFWSSNPSAVCAGILVMAFGDGLAGLIGREINSKTWIIFGQTKSIAGTLTMGISSTIILIILSILTGTDLSPIQLSSIAFLSIILEQIGPWGIDNITVPIGVAITWNLMGSS